MKLPLLPHGAALYLQNAEGVIGGKVWPAAGALCRHLLAAKPDNATVNLQVVELGSGTGAVGLFCAAAWRMPVVLTEHCPPVASVLSSVPYSVDGMLDLDDEFLQSKSHRLLHLLQQNVDANQALLATPNSVRIMELDWTKKEHREDVKQASASTKNDCHKENDGYDLILASDVTYVTQLHQPLADTISYLLRTNSKGNPNGTTPKAWVAHQQRLLNLKGQDWQLVEFQAALEQAKLEIVKTTPYEIYENENDDIVLDSAKEAFPTTTESSESVSKEKGHSVSILEIQHAPS